MQKTNTIGAGLAVFYYISTILLFSLRILGAAEISRGVGLVQTVLALPVGLYLFQKGLKEKRPTLFLIQVGFFILFLVVEILFDFVYKLDFRQDLRIVIPYVMLFFAGTGGLLGITSKAGKKWMTAAGILYLIMGMLAFVQRAITGM